jgi:hypothetical protein
MLLCGQWFIVVNVLLVKASMGQLKEKEHDRID